jgi:hypothetical protein
MYIEAYKFQKEEWRSKQNEKSGLSVDCGDVSPRQALRYLDSDIGSLPHPTK